jgi:hypothetical protein
MAARESADSARRPPNGGCRVRRPVVPVGHDEATVHTHPLKAFAKLDVADRTRAVMRAMELGIL